MYYIMWRDVPWEFYREGRCWGCEVASFILGGTEDYDRKQFSDENDGKL